jgi:hypothetical protein
MPVVFTPDNEPYLGRNLLYHFDSDHIVSHGAKRQDSTSRTVGHLSDHQRMACQVIAQSLSITLSIER